MKQIKTVDAVGHVLCHDMTQIIKDEYKGPRFKKGHVVTESDIPILLAMGKENLFVWELEPGMLHENDAAARLAALCLSDGMRAGPVREGKIELFAETDGLFTVASDKLNQINRIDELIVSTRHGQTAVKKGDLLCGTRVVPLVIAEEKICQAEQTAGGAPILSILPYVLKTAGVITTGSEVFSGRIQDAFTPVIERKLAEFGIAMPEHAVVDDGTENILSAITEMRQKGVDLILCTGGMSVDPDDNTPGAIKASGADIVTYGAPVLPGAMFLVGYYADGTPVLGLPGCVMYAAATIFDLALPRFSAGIKMTKTDFVQMGEGGLCLKCDIRLLEKTGGKSGDYRREK